ncbi:MAG TPA: DUF4136 domain-containing protein [Steroidobacteraceae bacterium]|nr:DUF4136 domain-containing protein [Steroidobacteraceae bacterium]
MDRLSTALERLTRACRIGAALVGLVLTSCASIRVGSDFDHAASFAEFHAFSWMPRENYGSRNPLVVEHARDAIQAALTRKGFAYVSDPAAADFMVDFTIGSRARMEVESYPVPYTGEYWGYRGWWGSRYWGTQIDVQQYREGTLAIDVFDAHGHRPVWHGWAKKELTKLDTERSEAPIREAVDAVLAHFPPH